MSTSTYSTMTEEQRTSFLTSLSNYRNIRYALDANFRNNIKETQKAISKDLYNNNPEYRERKKEQSRLYQQKKREMNRNMVKV